MQTCITMGYIALVIGCISFIRNKYLQVCIEASQDATLQGFSSKFSWRRITDRKESELNQYIVLFGFCFGLGSIILGYTL